MPTPSKPAKAADQALVVEKSVPSAPWPTVLVVEDDAGVRKMLDTALQGFNFSVRLAASGAQALEIYQHQAVDVVLMDVLMPAMDGPQTLAALKVVDPNVVCCFMSGHTGKYPLEELLNLGVAGVMQKPFHLTELRQMLLDAIAAKRRAKTP